MFQVRWMWPAGGYSDSASIFDLINATPEHLTNPDGSTIGFSDGHVGRMDNGNVAYKASGFRVTKEIRAPFYVSRLEFEGTFAPSMRLFTKTSGASPLFYAYEKSWLLDQGGAVDPTFVFAFMSANPDPPFVIRGLVETLEQFTDPLLLIQFGGLEAFMNKAHPTGSVQTLRGYVTRRF